MNNDLVVMSAGWWLLDDLFFFELPKILNPEWAETRVASKLTRRCSKVALVVAPC